MQRKTRLGARLQVTRILNTAPGNGPKPKLWGWYSEQPPSSCKVTRFNADGTAQVKVVRGK